MKTYRVMTNYDQSLFIIEEYKETFLSRFIRMFLNDRPPRCQWKMIDDCLHFSLDAAKRVIAHLERQEQFLKDHGSNYVKITEDNDASLATIDARYRDLLQRLGVQGHDGAIAEIDAMRKALNPDSGLL